MSAATQSDHDTNSHDALPAKDALSAKDTLEPETGLKPEDERTAADDPTIGVAGASDDLTRLGWRPFFAQQLKQPGTDVIDTDRLQPARVMSVARSELTLVSQNASLAIQLDREWQQRSSEDRPTVGDWVLITPSDQHLDSVLKRQSVFKRKAAGERADVQLIAANVDIVFIVSSCNDDFNLSRLERYLALAAESQVEPVVILTKADLCDAPDYYRDEARRLGRDLQVLTLNATAASSAEQLAPWCKTGQTLAFVGSSGVGKSTLINTLLGSEVQATGNIRWDDSKGRHTTTSRSLHCLSSGALVLDSPGIRELQLTDVAAGLANLFNDVEAFAHRCKFANCEHNTEPQCAVQEAIENGELEVRRLESYRKLKREDARNTQTIAQRHERSRKWTKAVKRQNATADKRNPRDI